MLLFPRHVSVADTLLPAVFVSSRNGILLRHVLKRELLWDPCLDIVGNRLPNCFVRRDSRDSAREIRAVAALAHDVIVTIGFFSMTGVSFDLSVVAAVLAVIGYSLNDTVVAFDRIRENFAKLRGVSPEEAMNTSINEMLARTIITGVTTLIVLTALLLLGGESVRPFSIALIVGIIVGTYSSIYTASATALMLHVTPQDLMPPEVDPELIDDLP